MPLASVTAHWMNGWGPPAPPPAAADVGGGASSTRPRYTPKPIKNARHRQYSTLYATADAAARKLVGAGGFVAALATLSTDVDAARAASFGTAAGRVAASPWIRRTVAADVSSLGETGVRAAAGIPEEERAARRQFAESQFLLIIDDEVSP